MVIVANRPAAVEQLERPDMERYRNIGSISRGTMLETDNMLEDTGFPNADTLIVCRHRRFHQPE